MVEGVSKLLAALTGSAVRRDFLNASIVVSVVFLQFWSGALSAPCLLLRA